MASLGRRPGCTGRKTMQGDTEIMMINRLGKPHRKFISVHLGIACLGGGSKPLPRWFVAPIFRRNVLVQMGICMILPENRCHRVGGGSNGYLGNAQMNRDFLSVGLPLYGMWGR